MTFDEYVKSVWPEGYDIELPSELAKAKAYLYWSLLYVYQGNRVLEYQLPKKTGGIVHAICFEPTIGLSGTALHRDLEEKLLIVAGNPEPIVYDLPEPLYVLPIPKWASEPIGSGNSRTHTPVWLQFKKEAEQMSRPFIGDLLKLFT